MQSTYHLIVILVILSFVYTPVHGGPPWPDSSPPPCDRCPSGESEPCAPPCPTPEGPELSVAPEGPGPEFAVGDVPSFADGNIARATDAVVFSSPWKTSHTPAAIRDGSFGPNGILFEMGIHTGTSRNHVPYRSPLNPPASGEVYVGIRWPSPQTIREVALGRDATNHNFVDRAHCEYTLQYTTDTFAPVSCPDDTTTSQCNDLANVAPAVNWITIGHAAGHLSEIDVNDDDPPRSLRGARRRYVFPEDITGVMGFRVKSVEYNTIDELEIGNSLGALDLTRAAETVCDDRVDGDGDGLTDCADSDCTAEQPCLSEANCTSSIGCAQWRCTNGLDDDGDGATDCDDSDCPNCMCNPPGLIFVEQGPQDLRDADPPGEPFDPPTYAEGNLSLAPDAVVFNSPHDSFSPPRNLNNGLYGDPSFAIADPGPPQGTGEKYVGIYWTGEPKIILEVAIGRNNRIWDHSTSEFSDSPYVFEYTTETFTPVSCPFKNNPCDDVSNIFPQVTWCAMGVARHHECEPARVLGLDEPSERSARRRYALPAEIPDVTAVRVRLRTDENIRIDELEILGVAVIDAGQNIAGDCNQDGEFDLSDVVCLLGHLFQGNPEELPCEVTAANLALMDCNQDDSIDLSDAIYKLAFLFQGGPPPELGTVCFGIPQCPENEGCP